MEVGCAYEMMDIIMKVCLASCHKQQLLWSCCSCRAIAWCFCNSHRVWILNHVPLWSEFSNWFVPYK